jgi:hypothetical protein
MHSWGAAGLPDMHLRAWCSLWRPSDASKAMTLLATGKQALLFVNVSPCDPQHASWMGVGHLTHTSTTTLTGEAAWRVCVPSSMCTGRL